MKTDLRNILIGMTVLHDLANCIRTAGECPKSAARPCATGKATNPMPPSNAQGKTQKSRWAKES